MHTLFITLFILLFTSFGELRGQTLKKHMWEDRIIVLLAKEHDNPVYQKQLSELKKHENGLRERKLVVYHGFPERSKFGLHSDKDLPNFVSLYTSYKTDKSFELLLFGLDGGIKLRRSSFTSISNIFALIDGMPMRQAEMRRKK